MNPLGAYTFASIDLLRALGTAYRHVIVVTITSGRFKQDKLKFLDIIFTRENALDNILRYTEKLSCFIANGCRMRSSSRRSGLK